MDFSYASLIGNLRAPANSSTGGLQTHVIYMRDSILKVRIPVGICSGGVLVGGDARPVQYASDSCIGEL